MWYIIIIKKKHNFRYIIDLKITTEFYEQLKTGNRKTEKIINLQIIRINRKCNRINLRK